MGMTQGRLFLLMDQQLITKTFEGHCIRILGTADAPLFVASDVCKILALGNVSQAINGNPESGALGLDDDEKGVEDLDTLGGRQKTLVVTESGLYSLIFKSRKSEAKAFQKWITSEVIPTIRKTGSYIIPVAAPTPSLPQNYVEALRALADKTEAAERLAIENAEQDRAIERMTPKEEFFDTVTAASNAIELNCAAKEIGVGRNKMMAFLRQKKILMHTNLPYQCYIDAGYFKIHTSSFPHPTNGDQVTLSTRVFQKGVDFIRKQLAANDIK